MPSAHQRIILRNVYTLTEFLSFTLKKLHVLSKWRKKKILSHFFIQNSYLKYKEDYFVKYLNILEFMLEHKLHKIDMLNDSESFLYSS